MERKPTYSGLVKNKDEEDILYWALNKTAAERLFEAWRLHCMNHNIPFDHKINKSISKASKQSE